MVHKEQLFLNRMLRAEFDTQDEQPITVKVYKTGMWDNRYDEYVDVALRDDVPVLEYNKREGLVVRDAEEVAQITIDTEMKHEVQVIREWVRKNTKKKFRIEFMDV
jgi:hypothetical protein